MCTLDTGGGGYGKVHHFDRLGSCELSPSGLYGTSKGQGTVRARPIRWRGRLNVFESQGISFSPSSRNSPSLSLSLSFVIFTLRTVEKRLVAPRAGIWKVFDVLAIQGENAERLIPKNPEDKLARFFFFFRSGRNISGERNRVRARMNKAFIRPEVHRIDVKFFSLNPPQSIICSPFSNVLTYRRISFNRCFISTGGRNVKVSAINEAS